MITLRQSQASCKWDRVRLQDGWLSSKVESTERTSCRHYSFFSPPISPAFIYPLNRLLHTNITYLNVLLLETTTHWFNYIHKKSMWVCNSNTPSLPTRDRSAPFSSIIYSASGPPWMSRLCEDALFFRYLKSESSESGNGSDGGSSLKLAGGTSGNWAR